MNLENYKNLMLPAVEESLQTILNMYRRTGVLESRTDPSMPDLYEMLSYHMGWDIHDAASASHGKRIRPLLVLLTCAAAGGLWEKALPAACAVELVHNFSLIHDDIQDESPLRHGRPTVWRRWGSAQAINAGDLMFTLALSSIIRPEFEIHPQLAVRAQAILTDACMKLTRGQALDLAYESLDSLEVNQYWPMVMGKTAALLSACTQLGGLFAGVDRECLEELSTFGEKLGLAFQVQDDLLGIWGNSVITGKSVDSDLVSRKKSLPILIGLSLGGPFAQYWKKGRIEPHRVPEIAALLETEGARASTVNICSRLTTEAMNSLHLALPDNEGRQALDAMVVSLLQRDS